MMIKVKGFRVSPDEVRDILMRDRRIRNAIAVGILNERGIEEIHAVVVLMDGCTADADVLRQYCYKQMPGYMVPTHIHIWDIELPKTANGKIDIQQVKTMVDSFMKNKEALQYAN